LRDPDVGNEDIGSHLIHHTKQLSPVTGFPYDLKVTLTFQEGFQPGTEDDVVICKSDTNHQTTSLSSIAGAGSVTWMDVPFPVEDVTRT
jgi:hypothetical protein